MQNLFPRSNNNFTINPEIISDGQIDRVGYASNQLQNVLAAYGSEGTNIFVYKNREKREQILALNKSQILNDISNNFARIKSDALNPDNFKNATNQSAINAKVQMQSFYNKYKTKVEKENLPYLDMVYQSSATENLLPIERAVNVYNQKSLADTFILSFNNIVKARDAALQSSDIKSATNYAQQAHQLLDTAHKNQIINNDELINYQNHFDQSGRLTLYENQFAAALKKGSDTSQKYLQDFEEHNHADMSQEEKLKIFSRLAQMHNAYGAAHAILNNITAQKKKNIIVSVKETGELPSPAEIKEIKSGSTQESWNKFSNELNAANLYATSKNFFDNNDVATNAKYLAEIKNKVDNIKTAVMFDTYKSLQSYAVNLDGKRNSDPYQYATNTDYYKKINADPNINFNDKIKALLYSQEYILNINKNKLAVISKDDAAGFGQRINAAESVKDKYNVLKEIKNKYGAYSNIVFNNISAVKNDNFLSLIYASGENPESKTSLPDLFASYEANSKDLNKLVDGRHRTALELDIKNNLSKYFSENNFSLTDQENILKSAMQYGTYLMAKNKNAKSAAERASNDLILNHYQKINIIDYIKGVIKFKKELYHDKNIDLPEIKLPTYIPKIVNDKTVNSYAVIDKVIELDANNIIKNKDYKIPDYFESEEQSNKIRSKDYIDELLSARKFILNPQDNTNLVMVDARNNPILNKVGNKYILDLTDCTD